jgi:hypothetical protein
MKRTILATVIWTLFFAAAARSDSRLEEKIKAARCDLKVICLAANQAEVEWSAALYLNQTCGAEVYIGILKEAPRFSLEHRLSSEGMFHLGVIGIPNTMADSAVADSVRSLFLGDHAPDIALFSAADVEDSVRLRSIVARWEPDNLAADTLRGLRKIFFRTEDRYGSDVIINDKEVMAANEELLNSLDSSFGYYGPGRYQALRYRFYEQTAAVARRGRAGNDFISGLNRFQLSERLASYFGDSPEAETTKKHLDNFCTDLTFALHPAVSRADQLQLLSNAYQEISRLVSTLTGGAGGFPGSLARDLTETEARSFAALKEAIGVTWNTRLFVRDTPFGEAAKLRLDLRVEGPQSIELSYFHAHPDDTTRITVDSVSQIIEPHQSFVREYLVPLEDLLGENKSRTDLRFSVEVIVDNQAIDFTVPNAAGAAEQIQLAFLPGHTFLEPFSEDNIEALVQPFDWQVMVAKPYGVPFSGRLDVKTPDGIVVGSFDDAVTMPGSVTRRYMDLHLAAGRSIGYDVKEVSADLLSEGQVVASAKARVRVIRCKIPETRDFAFVADDQGQLEDFLRMADVSFQPFTTRSLVRAMLDAYDCLIIGERAKPYYQTLSAVSDRLRDFVEHGGELLIFGQTVSWPDNILPFPLIPSEALKVSLQAPEAAGHPLLQVPYTISVEKLLNRVQNVGPLYPVLFSGGQEIIGAGEQGSLIEVRQIGEGYVIYCGLPLLQLAGELDVEAVHLLANLLNFGHGGK